VVVQGGQALTASAGMFIRKKDGWRGS